VLKDVVIRYYTMKGYDVWRQPGWDMHGLPIEVLVEKELGVKSKKDIEVIGVDKFVSKCREFALRNLKVMEKQFKRLGVWMDWNEPYMTIKKEWIETEWWTFKRAWEQGLIGRDLRVVHWCPRCETALAEHEIEYKLLEDPSIYVKFPLESRESEYVVIWTTTPWTLPANVAVLVHPEYDYSKVRVVLNGRVEYWWMAKARVEPVMNEIGVENYEVVETVVGEKLDGVRYIHPFLEEYPKQKEFKEKYERAHTVVLGEFVTLDEGTGCVHIAPGHGEEDYEIGKRYQLPVYCPVDKNGSYFEGKWKAVYVKKANPEIIQDLRDRGFLIYASTVSHKYPTCWRCKTPLIFRATEQWFLRVSKIKDKIIEENGKHVEWLPKWVKKRYENGVSNVGDWVISRQRYWNAPIPLWICKNCNHIEVIGSIAELKEKAKNELPNDIDPHRPWIDEVVLKCPKCGGDMKRIPDVLDVWFDSAIASWASLEYPWRKDLFEELWPANLIIEGQDQILKWFYAQQVLSIVAFGVPPYKKVAMHGFVLDAAGSKMSKSLGNVVTPEQVIQKYGADSLRMYLLSTTLPWEDIRFKWEEVDEVRRALDILWNVLYMVALYMELDKFNPSKIDKEMIRNHMLPEDKWLLSRVNSLIKLVESTIHSFQIAKGVRETMTFIVEDLSRWYGKLVRKRFWIEKDDPTKLAAYLTVFEVFKKLLAIMALYTPYLAEEIYQRFIKPVDENAPESVHMIEWPDADYIDEKLEDLMDVMRDLVSAVAAARQKAGLKLRWPVKRVIIETKEEKVREAIENLRDIAYEMFNTKKIEFSTVQKRWKAKPVKKSLGPKYKGEANKVAGALEKVDGSVIRDKILSEGKYYLSIGDKIYEISKEDVEFVMELPENLEGIEFRYGIVYVDKELDRELLSEAFSRELVRRIQEMRKQMDLDVEEKINVYVKAPDEFVSYVSANLDYVKNETRADNITFGDVSGYIKEWKIEGYSVTIGVERIKE